VNRRTFIKLIILFFTLVSITGYSKASEDISPPYFTKGVYLNYDLNVKNPPKDYFYVFYDETSGHTDDGSVGMGLPFECRQKDGFVIFSFGGADPENEETLTIESFENGVITGYFNNHESLIFIPVPKVNPDKFDAQKYLKTKKLFLYFTFK